MKAVMYHYVRPNSGAYPAYYHLSLDDFRKQLAYFSEHFGYVDKGDFFEAIDNKNSCPDGVVLTFDDGLIDHYQHVLPELIKRDLWGIFYVPTAPFRTRTPLGVHTVHALLGQYGGERTLEELAATVSDNMIDDGLIDRYREYTYRNQDESAATKVKRILNFYLDDSHRTEVLETLVQTLPAANIDVSEYYMSTDQLRKLLADGMVVGSHTETHRLMSRLPADEQRREIESSFQFIEDSLEGIRHRTYCHPYGGEKSYTDETIRILDEINCAFSFSVESRDVRQSDLSESIQTLPRYDCNEFPHGEPTGTVKT